MCKPLLYYFGILILAVSTGLSVSAQSGSPGADTSISVVATDSAVATDSVSPDSAGANATDAVGAKTPEKAALRTIPDSVLARYRKDPKFAYAYDPAYWAKKQNNNNDRNATGSSDALAKFLGSRWLRYFIYLLLAGVLVYALYRVMMENSFRLFDRASRKVGTEIEEQAGIAEEDPEEALLRALREHDYRAGIRCLYLKALRLLSDRGMIRVHAQATNQEYINQVNTYSQGKEFAYLTRAYDHVWYGDFRLNEQQFQQLRGSFERFYEAITSSRRTPHPPEGGVRSGQAAMGLLAALMVSGLSACHPASKEIDNRITLWRDDKIPYGTYVAYQNLSHIFPDANIHINKTSPAMTGAGLQTDPVEGSGKKAYIIIASRVNPDAQEMNALLNFAGAGNHVFISAFAFGDSLLHALNVKAAGATIFPDTDDSLRLSVYNPVTADSLSFTYPGLRYDDWARSIDTQYATVLGRDVKGRPDFLRFNYKGGGSLMLQFAPLAFSNFFLLYGNNMAYYNNTLSYLPASTSEVVWDEYFRYDHERDFSAFSFILSKEPLSWAFWLMLLLFAFIYLFESKRRQRMVPVINSLRNASLDFIRTIGRLYYQRRDNRNLVLKMNAHFLDHIRSRYNLPASVFDASLVEKLSFRMGIPKASLQELADEMASIQEQPFVTDAQLLAFNRKLEEFYQHA